MNTDSARQRFEKILKEFLADRDWEDELKTDKESKRVGLATSVIIGSYNGGRLFVDAYYDLEVVAVYFYLPFECSKEKRTELCLLLNDLNQRGQFGGWGGLQLLDDNRIRWVHQSDFEGSSPTGTSIEQIVGPGWERVNEFVEIIRGVALTPQSAADALALWENAAGE